MGNNDIRKVDQLDIDRGMTISQYLGKAGIRGGEVDLEDKGGQERSHADVAQLVTDADGQKYAVEGVLAQGGMGMVFDAKDVNIRRKVAMKVMKFADKPNAEQILRFVEEAQVTGQLEHPNIVPVYELGVDKSENAFYTMKMVSGRTLKDILKEIKEGDQSTIEEFPLTVLINAFLKICDAIAYAHSKGVIHRDLKPENIMIGDYGEVLVLDWGLSKILTEEEEDAASRVAQTGLKDMKKVRKVVESVRHDDESNSYVTMAGVVMGTPAYMAPEQAIGNAQAMNSRTDLYALGGILYSILTLCPPVTAENVRLVLLKVVNGEVIPPRDLEAQPGQRPHLPDGKVPAGLDAVVMKALATNPDDRYESVLELQREVEAWEGGYATQAEQASLFRQVSLLVKRNKKECAFIGSAVLLAGLLLTGFIIRLNVERKRALDNEKRALLAESDAVKAADEEKKARLLALAAKEEAESAKAEAESARAEALAHYELAQKEAYRFGLAEANRLALLGERTRTMDVLRTLPKELRNWEFRHLVNQAQIRSIEQKGSIYRVFKQGFTALELEYSPDGKYLALGGDNCQVYLLDAKTLKGHRNLTDLAGLHPKRRKGGYQHTVYSVAFSPDGKYLAAGGNDIPLACIWDTATGKLVRAIRKPINGAGVFALCFSQDGKSLYLGGHFHLWAHDMTTGKTRDLKGMRWIADLKELKSSGQLLMLEYDKLSIFDPRTGKFIRSVRTLKADRLSRMAISPDERYVSIAAGSAIDVVSMETGRLARQLKGHFGKAADVAYSADGKYIISGGEDQTVRLWDANSGRQLVCQSANSNRSPGVRFSPDGKQIATAHEGSRAFLWNALSPADQPTISGIWHSPSYSPDGTMIGAINPSGIRFWGAVKHDLLNESAAAKQDPHGRTRICWAADSSKVAVFGASANVQFVDVKTGKLLWANGDHKARVADVKSGPNGLVIHDGKTLYCRNEATGKLNWSRTPANPVRALGPKGNYYASIRNDGKNWFLDIAKVKDGKDAKAIPLKMGPSWRKGFFKAIFSADGKTLFISYFGCQMTAVDLTSERPIFQVGSKVLNAHGDVGAFVDATMTSDGSRVVTVTNSGKIGIWTREGNVLLTMPGAETVQFHPKIESLLSLDPTGGIRVWKASDYRDKSQ